MNKLILLSLVLLLLLNGCDDGKIYPKESDDATGKKVTLKARFKGIEAWPQAYQLILAGFNDETEIPLISKVVPTPNTEDQEVTVTLNGVTDDVRVISVIVATKGRSLIHSFYRLEIEDNEESDFTLPVDEINVASYARIQEQVFDLYCASCHGAGAQAAAGLYLTEGRSYNALINKKATLSTDEEIEMLVEPGKANQSFLYHILVSNIIRYNHTDVLPESELKTLIQTWIDKGASKE